MPTPQIGDFVKYTADNGDVMKGRVMGSYHREALGVVLQIKTPWGNRDVPADYCQILPKRKPGE